MIAPMKPRPAAAAALSLSVILAACAATAQTSQPAQAQGQAQPHPGPPAHVVGEVVVPGGPAPQLVASYPAAGAQVPSGVLTLKLVFDTPVDAAHLAVSKAAGSPTLECARAGYVPQSGKSVVLLCRAQLKTAYDVQVTGVGSASGRLAPGLELKFTTTDAVTDSMPEALEQAGLTKADEPVTDWTGAEASPQ